jgi:hypothetical protein
MGTATSRSMNRTTGQDQRPDVSERLRRRYEEVCPAGYQPQQNVDAFYSAEGFWHKFHEWIENASDSYPASDKAFVESAVTVDGARVINIGTYYPWAEVEWGARAAQWLGLDNNPAVLARAREVLARYPAHRVTLMEADVTQPLDIGARFDFVLDLSTLDHLDPRRYATILGNYKRLADCLVLAYDATEEPFATFDFERCGFNALLNPDMMAGLLEETGYRVVEHRPFAYRPYRSYIKAVAVSPIARGGSTQ